jgi:hypothetical protein
MPNGILPLDLLKYELWPIEALAMNKFIVAVAPLIQGTRRDIHNADKRCPLRGRDEDWVLQNGRSSGSEK